MLLLIYFLYVNFFIKILPQSLFKLLLSHVTALRAKNNKNIIIIRDNGPLFRPSHSSVCSHFLLIFPFPLIKTLNIVKFIFHYDFCNSQLLSLKLSLIIKLYNEINFVPDDQINQWSHFNEIYCAVKQRTLAVGVKLVQSDFKK